MESNSAFDELRAIAREYKIEVWLPKAPECSALAQSSIVIIDHTNFLRARDYEQS